MPSCGIYFFLLSDQSSATYSRKLHKLVVAQHGHCKPCARVIEPTPAHAVVRNTGQEHIALHVHTEHTIRSRIGHMHTPTGQQFYSECACAYTLICTNSNTARAKGEVNSDAGLLLMGISTGLMWLRTLNFVLVQQDLGQV